MANRAAVVKTMMEAFRRLSFGLPSDYLPGLESGIWFGDHAARELAIPELARFRSGAPPSRSWMRPPRILPEQPRDPVLRPDRRPPRRFWLETQLRGEDRGCGRTRRWPWRASAAPPPPLKDAMKSDERADARPPARLLPVAGLDDITALHEYAAAYPDDEPGWWRRCAPPPPCWKRPGGAAGERFRDAPDGAH
jgi:hypothetical protein